MKIVKLFLLFTLLALLLSLSILAYERIYREQALAVYLNFLEEPRAVAEGGEVLLGIGNVRQDDGRLVLAGSSGVVMRK